MTLNDLSSEQQDLVRLALDGKNVLCDACIGSGKTSTINVLCNEFDSSKEILYLTYNRLLKLDAQEKILNDNVTVQNYHGFASKILYRRGIKNVGQGEQIGMVLRKRVPVGHFDVLIIDEYQDINEEISKMLEYIKESNPGLQIIAVGDMKQKIYDQTSLDAAWDLVKNLDAETREGLRRAAGRDGLQGQAGGVKLHDLAREAVAIAEAGLKARARPGAGGLVPDETHFLNALKESVDTGRVPADELLAKYHGEWHGDLTRIYGEYSY